MLVRPETFGPYYVHIYETLKNKMDTCDTDVCLHLDN